MFTFVLQHGDMNAGTKLAALNKFRSTTSGLMRQPAIKVLVVYDVQVKTPEVSQIPLIINYGMNNENASTHTADIFRIDLPKAVEEYAHRYAFPVCPSINLLTLSYLAWLLLSHLATLVLVWLSISSPLLVAMLRCCDP